MTDKKNVLERAAYYCDGNVAVVPAKECRDLLAEARRLEASAKEWEADALLYAKNAAYHEEEKEKWQRIAIKERAKNIHVNACPNNAPKPDWRSLPTQIKVDWLDQARKELQAEAGTEISPRDKKTE